MMMKISCQEGPRNTIILVFVAIPQSVQLIKLKKWPRRKGQKVLLTTYEFQARSYYEMKGYKVVGEIKDYPPGTSYYTMVKILSLKTDSSTNRALI